MVRGEKEKKVVVGPETQVTAPQVAEQAEKRPRRLLESHKKGGSCRGRVQRGEPLGAPGAFLGPFLGLRTAQKPRMASGLVRCCSWWRDVAAVVRAGRRCSAGPSGRSSGEQRASSGASSSFLALQGRAWGLARKDYGTGGRKIQAWAASESLLEGQDVSRLERLERQDRRRYRERGVRERERLVSEKRS